jgi:hypothetical protein
MGIDSGGVGDEADALALQFGELALLQDIDPEFDARGLEQRRGEQQPGKKKGRAGEGHASAIGYRRGAGWSSGPLSHQHSRIKREPQKG